MPTSLKQLKIRSFETPGAGELFVLEDQEIGFPIKRTFWIRNLPILGHRGGHAHKQGWQCIIVNSGAIKLEVLTPECVREWQWLRTGESVIVPPMYWIDIIIMKPHTEILCLASNLYSEDDYIREKVEFERIQKNSV